MTYLKFCIAAMLLMVGAISAPAQEPTKRQATVLTADDKKFEGTFVKADDSGVTLENGDVQTTVKLDTVKTITFGETGTAAALKHTTIPEAAVKREAQSKEAADKAISAVWSKASIHFNSAVELAAK